MLYAAIGLVCMLLVLLLRRGDTRSSSIEKKRISPVDEKFLRLFVKHCPAAVAMFDREMRYVMVSDRWLDDYRLHEPSIIGKTHYEVFPEVPERWKAIHQRCLTGVSERCDEDSFERVDGTLEWLKWEIQPWHNSSGEIGGIIMFTNVITDRKNIETSLHEKEQRLNAVVNNVVDGIITLDSSGFILTANSSAGRLFGCQPADLVGLPLNSLLLRQDKNIKSILDSRLSSGDDCFADVFEMSAVKDTGVQFPIEIGFSMTNFNGRTVITCILRDITERKRQEEEISRIAYYDSLTGLPNRTLFQDRLSVALANAARKQDQLAVMFIDLDGFKRINDELGHAAGDEALIEIGRRLRGAIRDCDTAARLGGDEFVVLLPAIHHRDAAARVAHRIHRSFHEAIVFGEQSFFVGGSIGISIFPQDGQDSEKLVKSADASMYQAKRYGSGFFVYASDLSSAPGALAEHV
ncbi:MAG: diguanylate cyclase [bacterium]|nr:diguanylate cyclase [bacterium]